MANEGVYLTKLSIKRRGKVYDYWALQWIDQYGKNHCKSIGSARKLSRRQANKIRKDKETEFDQKPGRRNIAKAPRLSDFLKEYYQSRENELAPGTMVLHRTTGRYLEAHFGKLRRLDIIQRGDARAFKANLARRKKNKGNGELVPISPATVNLHMRNARSMFNIALDDDLIQFNPFDRLAGKAPPPKAWHEVTKDEFEKLMKAATLQWKILLALARYAGLRRGEALNLRWQQIDWERSRITVIANEHWQPKDKDSRVIPMSVELKSILLDAFDMASTGQQTVISPAVIKTQNISRDFTVLCKRAGVGRYHKPLHTLRKTCLTAWSREFPQHVITVWAGHSDEATTSEFYLKVSEAEYDKAAGIVMETKQENPKVSHLQ